MEKPQPKLYGLSSEELEAYEMTPGQLDESVQDSFDAPRVTRNELLEEISSGSDSDEATTTFDPEQK